jgi:hypothetical protein
VYEEPVELRIGRAEWKHWAGTPADVAEIAQLALDLVQRDSRTGVLKIEVAAPAFEAKFGAPDQVRDGLKPADLAEVTEVVISADEVRGSQARRRIALTIRRPPRTRPGSSGEQTAPVKLVVSADDREWVDLATPRIKDRIAAGARATERVQAILLAGVLAFGIGAVVSVSAFGDNVKGLNAGEVVAIVLAGVAGLLLLAVLSLGTITPQLELIPEGATTKWERLKRRVNFSGRWLLDTVLKAAVGAAVVLLIDHLS